MLIDMDALGKGDMIGLAAVAALTLDLALIPYVVVADRAHHLVQSPRPVGCLKKVSGGILVAAGGAVATS